MRGAGCTFNDMVDKDFDVQVCSTEGGVGMGGG